MPVVEESVVIARSPQEVFDFIAEPDNLPVWDSSVLSVERVGARADGPGSRTRGTSKILGRRFEWTTQETVVEPPTRLRYTSVEGALSFTVTNDLEPVAGGTRLIFRIEAESGLGGVFGRLADPFIAGVQGRTVRANLDNLAQLLEHPEA